MPAERPIIIATRGSALALAQANLIAEQCRKTFPRLRFELKIIKTTGDKLQTASLSKVGGSLPKGLFTKELEVALVKGQADLAVHSLKDLPTDLPAGLILAATPKREDVRDVDLGGKARREVFFANRVAMTAGKDRPELKGRDVLLVDAVIDSGITQDFLLRRIGESRPRSLRLAVLLDKTSRRRVALEPDYFGFRTASNLLWSGYGLAGADGTGGNAKQLATGNAAKRPGQGKRGRKKRVGSKNLAVRQGFGR